MNATRTPGPWHFLPGGEGGDESVGVPPEPDMIAHCYDRETKAFVAVATIESPSYWDRAKDRHVRLGDREANAHLIAAAPDLLAACEAAMEVFRDFDLGHMVAFETLSAAIDKATGNTPA